jgi:hypothetical protein
MTEQLQLRRGAASQVATFTGAQGEVVVDTTNNRAVVNDGSTAGGWPAAKLAEVITNTRTMVSDAPYSALASDRSVAYVALTAARIVTLPASSAYPLGTTLTVFDESGACSATNTITLQSAGSDTIDGAASVAIATAYGYAAVQSNGAGKWTVLAQPGVSAAPSRTAVADAPYTALSTDRVIAYTALTAARIVTLCAAATYPAGTRLTIIDESGACSATSTITIQRAGADTIDGATSFAIEAAYGALEIASNGSSAWTILSPCPNGQISLLGIGTPPDPSNVLSAYGASALLSGAANFNLTINKGGASGASADTASLIFEDGFSGRAQMGLNGSDNFSFKVSPNGSSWTTAIAIDATTGAPTFANQRTAISDAPYTALTTDRSVAYTALTAARIVTLPASSAYPVGMTLTIFDETGACSATNTITLQRSGSDTIDGAASAVIATVNGFLALQSNGAGKWTIVDSAIVTPASATAGHVAIFGATPNAFADGGTNVRQLLSSAATFYVRAVVGNPTISNASPAVATLAAHGLQANDPVVFSILPFQTAITITQANPAVVTWNAHGFSAGQPVVFASTGMLPYGIAAGTTYFVIAAGLTTNAFEISATVGGSAISTAAPTLTFTNGSANIGLATASTYLKVGQQVQFANSGGALPTNFASATTYYVLSVNTTTITVSATNGGSAISAGSAGTGTQSLSQVGTHYGSATGSLPTGVTAGQVYYVLSAGLTSGAFEFSATIGGAAINTSGAQAGTISCATGNDANNGLAQNRAGALLTMQAAYNLITAGLDLGGRAATIQLADGVHTDNLAIGSPWSGGGEVVLQGNSSFPSNPYIAPASASAISVGCGLLGNLLIQNCALGGVAGAPTINVGAAAAVVIGNIDFIGPSEIHIQTNAGAFVSTNGPYMISGAMGYHIGGFHGAFVQFDGQTISILGVPAISGNFLLCSDRSGIEVVGDTFVGSATGNRYSVVLNGVINTGGAGASFLPGNSAGSSATGGQYA